MSKEIIVKQVNLQQDEIDRLMNTIELKDDTIKYQQNQYLKLQRKLDNKENFGLNNLFFSYTEIIEILKSNYHPLRNYIERWFGTFQDFEENEGLFFSEDGIEVEENDYWLVNIKTDYACTIRDLDRLNRKIYELENDGRVNARVETRYYNVLLEKLQQVKEVNKDVKD